MLNPVVWGWRLGSIELGWVAWNLQCLLDQWKVLKGILAILYAGEQWGMLKVNLNLKKMRHVVVWVFGFDG